jgi:hypothetical protein
MDNNKIQGNFAAKVEAEFDRLIDSITLEQELE